MMVDLFFLCVQFLDFFFLLKIFFFFFSMGFTLGNVHTPKGC